MEIQNIKEFLVLSEICNYGEASDSLYISQSSLFKHIKSLENELGVSLFDRNGKNIVLNKYGKIFRDYGERLVRLEDACKSDLRAEIGVDSKYISISTQYRITDIVTEFRKKNKDYMLNIYEENMNGDVAKSLYKGKCELAFLYNSSDYGDKFVEIPYTTDRLILVVYNSHPLAAWEHVKVEALINEEFITMPQNPTQPNPHRTIFQDACFKPKTVMTAARGSDAVDLVRQELGIAILFHSLVEHMDTEGITMVELDNAREIEIKLCYLRGTHLSTGAKKFIEFITARSQNDLL